MEVKDNQKKPTICLNMIVKNEEHVVLTMLKQMAPMIEGAKNMLGGFDIKGLTNSLNKVSDISGITGKKE